MKIKYFYFIALISLWTLTIVVYFWFIKTSYFEVFNEWTERNLLIFYSILFISKVLAIVWPPLPGSLFTLGSIPFIGWPAAFGVEIVGGLTGASIAYYLGKWYGYPFLAKIFSKEMIDKIRQIKVRKDREIESVFMGRMVGVGIMEIICYGAGVLNVRFSRFLIASFLASILALPIFFLGGNVFKGGNILVGLAFAVITLFIFWKIKGRYVE